MGASKLLHRILKFINYANLCKFIQNQQKNATSPLFTKINAIPQICTSGGNVYYASHNLLIHLLLLLLFYYNFFFVGGGGGGSTSFTWTKIPAPKCQAWESPYRGSVFSMESSFKMCWAFPSTWNWGYYILSHRNILTRPVFAWSLPAILPHYCLNFKLLTIIGDTVLLPPTSYAYV